jgi:hypothetical protein
METDVNSFISIYLLIYLSEKRESVSIKKVQTYRKLMSKFDRINEEGVLRYKIKKINKDQG